MYTHTHTHTHIHIYIYICLHVCGWLGTLYNGLLWPYECPSLITSALDLVVWVCAQGDYGRCIFMLFCVHNHRGVIVLIHVTWVTLVSPCMQHASTCLMLWRVSARHSTSMSIRAIYTDALPMRHSAPNAKLCLIFAVKMGHPRCRILKLKAWWE